MEVDERVLTMTKLRAPGLRDADARRRSEAFWSGMAIDVYRFPTLTKWRGNWELVERRCIG
jgi:hypothetical protein